MTKQQDQLAAWSELLRSFLDDLRRDGFRIGIEQFVSVQDLLIALASRDQLPTGVTELFPLVCPLIATSGTEQQEFERRFRDFCVSRLELTSSDEKDAPLMETDDDASSMETAEGKLQKQSRTAATYAVLLSIAVLALVAAGIRLYLVPETPMVTPNPGTTVSPSPQSGPTNVAKPIEEPISERIVWIGFWIACCALPVLGVFLYLSLRKVADAVLERKHGKRQPTIHNLRVSGVGTRLFDAPMIARAARSLRMHQRVESTRLDVPNTVDKTVDFGGVFSPVNATVPRLPDYLVLIDRTTFRDHQASLADALIDSLANEGLFVVRFYFDGDPRTCHPPDAGDPVVLLTELAGRYSEFRLWIFTDGTQLFSPFSGRIYPWTEAFSSWSNPTLFTPEAVSNWGPRESSLESAGFTVLPATEAGLMISSEPHLKKALLGPNEESTGALLPASIRTDVERWLSPNAPRDSVVETLIDDLQYYLGPLGFQWFCLLAVYPELRWELTIFLGSQTNDRQGNPLLRFQELSRMARLPWLRAGYIPDWLRLRLLDELNYGQERNVRHMLEVLLRSSLDGPTEGFDLRIATDPSLLDRLLEQSTAQKADEFLNDIQDPVYLSSGNSRLSLKIPRSLQRFIRSSRRTIGRTAGQLLPEPSPLLTLFADLGTGLLLGLIVLVLRALVANELLVFLYSVTGTGLLCWLSMTSIAYFSTSVAKSDGLLLRRFAAVLLSCAMTLYANNATDYPYFRDLVVFFLIAYAIGFGIVQLRWIGPSTSGSSFARFLDAMQPVRWLHWFLWAPRKPIQAPPVEITAVASIVIVFLIPLLFGAYATHFFCLFLALLAIRHLPRALNEGRLKIWRLSTDSLIAGFFFEGPERSPATYLLACLASLANQNASSVSRISLIYGVGYPLIAAGTSAIVFFGLVNLSQLQTVAKVVKSIADRVDRIMPDRLLSPRASQTFSGQADRQSWKGFRTFIFYAAIGYSTWWWFALFVDNEVASMEWILILSSALISMLTVLRASLKATFRRRLLVLVTVFGAYNLGTLPTFMLVRNDGLFFSAGDSLFEQLVRGESWVLTRILLAWCFILMACAEAARSLVSTDLAKKKLQHRLVIAPPDQLLASASFAPMGSGKRTSRGWLLPILAAGVVGFLMFAADVFIHFRGLLLLYPMFSGFVWSIRPIRSVAVWMEAVIFTAGIVLASDGPDSAGVIVIVFTPLIVSLTYLSMYVALLQRSHNSLIWTLVIRPIVICADLVMPDRLLARLSVVTWRVLRLLATFNKSKNASDVSVV